MRAPPAVFAVTPARALFALLAAAFALGAGDRVETARDIVRRSAVLHEHNFQLARNYTFTERVEQRKLDSDGREKSASSQTFDITFLFGVPYRRLIAKDGQPLSPAETKKEEEKLSHAFAARERESEAAKQKRRAEYEKRRERAWAFLSEIPDAFDFRLLGKETIQGRPAYVIEATPRAGYRPHSSDARIFPKLRGKLWIDKSEYEWVKGEAETTGTISFGLFLARLASGSRLEFEQTKVNDEVWLPRRIAYEGSGRLALFKKVRAGGEITYGHYKKFESDFEITIPASGAPAARPGRRP